MTSQSVCTCLVTHEYPPLPGGVGVSVRRIAKILASHGIKVHVAVLKKVDHPILIGKNINTYTDDEIIVHDILFSQGLEGKEIGSLTVPEIDFQDYRGHIETLLSLRRLHEEYHFSIVHGFFLSNVGMTTSLFAQLANLPHILSIRGNDVGKNIFVKEQMATLSYLLQKATFVTSVSSDLMKIAESINSSFKKKVILNSFDADRLKDFKPCHKGEQALTIACVGIFRFKKGLPYLIEALEKVIFPVDWKLLLIGEYLSEEERIYHQYFIDRSSFRERITLTGLIQKKEILNVIDQADIVVAPSLLSEGCPNSVLESMAIGKAVICSDAGAHPELIEDGKTGLLYKQHDIDELGAKLQLLVDSPDVRKYLGQNAKEYIPTLLNKEWTGWQEVYEECLNFELLSV